MASIRHLRWKACKRKRQYSQDQAEGIKRTMVARGSQRVGVYRCKFCNQWHIGHHPASIRKIIADRRGL